MGNSQNGPKDTRAESGSITLQAGFREILRSNGGNDFKIPHLKKQVHRRAGKPIVNVTCDAVTILKAHELLDKSIQ